MPAKFVFRYTPIYKTKIEVLVFITLSKSPLFWTVCGQIIRIYTKMFLPCIVGDIYTKKSYSKFFKVYFRKTRIRLWYL